MAATNHPNITRMGDSETEVLWETSISGQGGKGLERAHIGKSDGASDGDVRDLGDLGQPRRAGAHSGNSRSVPGTPASGRTLCGILVQVRLEDSCIGAYPSGRAAGGA